MYTGRIVEMADTHELFHHPRHPYTEALLNALPVPDPEAKSERVPLQGEVADPSDLPPGCAFHPRCRYCRDECKQRVPELREVDANHLAACVRVEDIELEGVKQSG
jgi:peptide/nickel transport system ATP-binding protein